MEYRSYADLAEAACMHAFRVPPDIDLVVGIPRSGVMPAAILALQLNVPFQDLTAYLADIAPAIGRTAKTRIGDGHLRPRRVLVVDDSIASGDSMREVRDRIERLRPDIPHVYLAVYGSTPYHADADIILEAVPMPRLFQWNLMRHARLADACIDIDGVLCHDPTADENDDGDGYVQFLLTARPLLKSCIKVKHLVTSRLEKYRAQTEQWLRDNGVEYEQLWMLDLPSAEERRRRGAHAQHKAKIYTATGAGLFIESEFEQAQAIATLSGKPVLSIEGQLIVWPDGSGKQAKARYARRQRAKKEGSLRVFLRSLLVPIVGSKNIAVFRKAARRALQR